MTSPVKGVKNIVRAIPPTTTSSKADTNLRLFFFLLSLGVNLLNAICHNRKINNEPKVNINIASINIRTSLITEYDKAVEYETISFGEAAYPLALKNWTKKSCIVG